MKELHSGRGLAIGDFDNDGRDDVYITALEGDHLLHNEGGGHFRDVTAEAGIHNANFVTSAAWLDYDQDGKLDLFVANYVQWTPEADLYCSMDGLTKSYCTPESYKGTSSKLYRNLGGGKFADVTEQAGLGDPTGKSLGVATFAYDGDGFRAAAGEPVHLDDQPSQQRNRGQRRPVARRPGPAWLRRPHYQRSALSLPQQLRAGCRSREPCCCSQAARRAGRPGRPDRTLWHS